MPPVLPPEVHVTFNPDVVFAIVAIFGAFAALALIVGFSSGRRMPKLPAVYQPIDDHDGAFTKVSPPQRYSPNVPSVLPPEVHVTSTPIVVFAIVAIIGGCALIALIAGIMSSRKTPRLPPTPRMAIPMSSPPPPPRPTPEAPLPTGQPTVPWSTRPAGPEVDDPRR